MLRFRQGMKNEVPQMFMFPVLVITVYMISYLLFEWNRHEISHIVVSLMGTYISSVCLNYIYYHVKNYEQTRDQLCRTEQHQVIE